MKKLKIKIVGLFLMFAFFSACNDSYDPHFERNATIGELFIKNAGADGKTAIKGEYDAESNTYTFDNVPAESDLQNIRFNGQISLGAAPEFETYDFFKTNPQVVKIVNRDKHQDYNVKFNILEPAMDPSVSKVEVLLEDGITIVVGEVDVANKTLWLDAKKGDHVYLKSITMFPKHAQYEFTKMDGTRILAADPGSIKMNHMGRLDEYAIGFITIDPIGFDIEKMREFDFATGAIKYPNAPGAQDIRGQATIDADRIIVPVGRTKMEYVPLASILNGNLNGKMTTTLTDVNVNNAFAFNGYVYTIPLQTSKGFSMNILKDLSQPSLGSSTAAFSEVPSRHGDGSSMQLDENGDGYVFSISGLPVERENLFIGEIKGYTQFTNPRILEIPMSLRPNGIPGQAAHMYFNPVRDHSIYGSIGMLNEYILIEHRGLFMLDRDFNTLFQIPSVGGGLPADCLFGCVFTFNKGRYLGLVTSKRPGRGTAYIYDITEGSTTLEGLQNFKTVKPAPIYTKDLGDYSGAAFGATMATTTNREGDKLYVLALAGNGGMVVLELPKKVDE